MKWPRWLCFGYRYEDAADQQITHMTATGRIETVKPNLSHGASLPREIFDGPSSPIDPAWHYADEITKIDSYTTPWIVDSPTLEVTHPKAVGWTRGTTDTGPR